MPTDDQVQIIDYITIYANGDLDIQLLDIRWVIVLRGAHYQGSLLLCVYLDTEMISSGLYPLNS